MTTGWRKKLIMMEQQQQQMEKLDPLEVVKLMVEALDEAYEASVSNSSKRPEWVGLTDEDMGQWVEEEHDVLRWAETKLKEKNGYA
jgi:hypothetical protein